MADEKHTYRTTTDNFFGTRDTSGVGYNVQPRLAYGNITSEELCARRTEFKSKDDDRLLDVVEMLERERL